MSVIYRFTHGTMGGYMFGEYTVEQALGWALADLAEGTNTEPEIWKDGELVYNSAAIEEIARNEPAGTEPVGRAASGDHRAQPAREQAAADERTDLSADRSGGGAG